MHAEAKDMGKGNRKNAARAAQRSSHAAAPVRPAAEQELSAAVIVVGELFGIEPDCASAAALLTEVGAHLGYDLRPRPVSVLVHDQPTSSILAMGPKATAKLPPAQQKSMENHRPNGKDTGHLVLTSDGPSLVLDPNMRQLGTYGVDAPSIIIRVKSTQPESGEWQFSRNGLSLLYFLDEENHALLPMFEQTRRDPNVVAIARKIGEGIRSGADLGTIISSVRTSALAKP